jgi:hypothetical protein
MRVLSCDNCPLITHIPDTFIDLRILQCFNCPELAIPLKIWKNLTECRGCQKIVDTGEYTSIEKKIKELIPFCGEDSSSFYHANWDKKTALSSSVGCFIGEEGTLCDLNDQNDYNNQ